MARFLLELESINPAFACRPHLARAMKCLLRHFYLRCVSVKELSDEPVKNCSNEGTKHGLASRKPGDDSQPF